VPLEAPSPDQLTFSADEVDAHANQTFGNRIAIEAKNGELGCTKYCARLSDVFSRLKSAAPSVIDAKPVRWRLVVGSNPRETAWALAGGRLYISESFIDEYTLSDAELAFVLAHEMSHVLLQHENEELTVAAAFVPRAVSQSVDSMYEALDFDLGLTLKLQPELYGQEFEADRAGMLLAGAAGFKPQEMLEFFRKLSARDDADSSVIRTHPAAKERWRRALAVTYSAEVLRARNQMATQR